MDIKMLESGATNNHVSGRGKINQPQSIIGRFLMQAEFTDCGTKYAFSAHLGVEVTKHDFNIMAGAAIINFIQMLIEGS